MLAICVWQPRVGSAQDGHQAVELSASDVAELRAESDGSAADTLEEEVARRAPPVEAADDRTVLSLPSGTHESTASPQALSLPQGGGSIEGYGETFSMALATGSGAYSIPIATGGGRAGVAPSLSLSYGATQGDGPVGVGWSMGTPFIGRATDRGVPRYVDSGMWTPTEDRFFFNGGQELVPVSTSDAELVDCGVAGCAPVPSDLSGWQQYRARIEGAFMRFFRSPGGERWVVQSDGSRMDFGLLPTGEGPAEMASASATALVSEDVGGAGRIYRWLLTRSSDAHGSVIWYQYSENRGERYLDNIYWVSPHGACGGLSSAAERRRCPAPTSDYGRRVHVVYEPRSDVTTSYTSGWEIATALRVRRIEVTAASGGPGTRALVRRYHLRYVVGAHHSLLESVVLEGRPSVFDGTLGVEVGDTTVSEASLSDSIVGTTLPPAVFHYTTQPGTGAGGFGGIAGVVARSSSSPPVSLGDADVDLFDMNSDGLVDVLATARRLTGSGAAVYFNGFSGATGTPAASGGEFSSPIPVGVPVGRSAQMILSNQLIRGMDADADGRSDLFYMPRTDGHGYFTPVRGGDGDEVRVGSQGWRFVFVRPDLPAGARDPRIDLTIDHARIRVMDVNGDRLIDVVRTTGTTIETWLNLSSLPGGEGRLGSYRVAPGSSGGFELSSDPIETCLLDDGVPLDFADSSVRTADMNGDGLSDIVRFLDGRVVYWPGRGEGAWGVGNPSCGAGLSGGRYVTMSSAPHGAGLATANVTFADVNADGTSDVVEVLATAVRVWFNASGTTFSAAVTVGDLPFSSALSRDVQLIDIDGSGTVDVLYGRGSDWRWVDLMGGVRPRVMVSIDGGLGGRSETVLESSVVDYLRDLRDAEACSGSVCERFTWSQLDPEWDAHLADVAEGHPHVWRSGGTPVGGLVVRETRATDRFDVLGQPATVVESRYAYHDGYYEGIEQEFRGFGAADSTSVGDEMHPSQLTRTRFYQGRRPNAMASDRWSDNPYEAAKGFAYRTDLMGARSATPEVIDQYLSSTHSSIRIRRLHQGLNGVGVWQSLITQSDTISYDMVGQAAGSDLLSLPSIHVDGAASSADHELFVRATRWAHVRTTTDEVDNLGHALSATAWGRLRGEFGEPVPDERVTTHTTALSVPGNEGGWMWRPSETYVTGYGDTTRFGQTSTAYDSEGSQTSSSATITQPVHYEFLGDGDGAVSYGSPAPAPVSSSATYDVWGQAIRTCSGGDATTLSGCLRFGEVRRDADWAAFVESESFALRRDGAGFEMLTTTGVMDRGLDAVIAVTEPNGEIGRVYYDGLGRVTTSVPPPARGCSGATPSARIRYEITTDPIGRPVSRIFTTTILSCDGSDVRQAIAYVDGAGTARATLTPGDSPTEWVRSGIVLRSARGAIRRAFRPSLYTGSVDDLGSALATPATPFVENAYDAAGRVTASWDEAHHLTMTSYHALSTDVCDPLDNGETVPGMLEPAALYAGTCTTSRSDGHGRTIDLIQRNRRVESVATMEWVRLFSDYRADGAVVHVVRAETADENPRPSTSILPGHMVERFFVYDSHARRIGSTDPDTDSRDPGRSAANRGWRYLYNGAGDVAAMRDPRGCGQNFFYDFAGRLIGEQYVGCAEAQTHEAPVDVVPGGSFGLDEVTSPIAVDARYYFDRYDESWAPDPSVFRDYPMSGLGGTLGRSVGSADRAARSVAAYDRRGTPVWSARQVAVLPGAVPEATWVAGSSPTVDTNDGVLPGSSVLYDEEHTYVVTTAADHAGRPRTLVLPADPDFPGGEGPRMLGTVHYGYRGLPTSIEAAVASGGGVPSVVDGVLDLGASLSYYSVVQHVDYDIEGAPLRTVFGDGAPRPSPCQLGSLGDGYATESCADYDARHMPLHGLTVHTPTEASTGDRSLHAVSILAADRFVWDPAGNLVLIDDQRPAEEWPDGQRPRTVYTLHDALYHVVGAEFEYAHDGGLASAVDTGSDWRAELARTRPTDPMRAEPAPMLGAHPSGRAVSLTWTHDWLGNTREWTDDAHAFYERSIGDITNGVDAPGAALRPSALYLAADLAGPVGSRGGYVEIDYGEGGNVVEMTAHAGCTDAPSQICIDPGGIDVLARRESLHARCVCSDEQHYQYRWDELNRLAEARRYDRGGAVGAYELAARQRYRYDAGNQRVVEEVRTRDEEAGWLDRISLTIVPGDLERRGLVVHHQSYVSSDSLGTETQYLVGGARIVWEDAAPSGAGLDPDHRMTVAVGDLLGTTSAVIDLVSHDVVEASTYYPNGAQETYRSQDDSTAAEPAGFTGKEADDEVGVTYFGERYLIPRIGRWASADPLAIHALGGGEAMNSYHYVSGNILQTTDPLGLASYQIDNDNIVSGDVWYQRQGQGSDPNGGTFVAMTGPPPPQPSAAPAAPSADLPLGGSGCGGYRTVDSCQEFQATRARLRGEAYERQGRFSWGISGVRAPEAPMPGVISPIGGVIFTTAYAAASLADLTGIPERLGFELRPESERIQRAYVAADAIGGLLEAGAAVVARPAPPAGRCFPAGTPVAMEDGARFVEGVEVGDRVAVSDPSLCPHEAREMVRVGFVFDSAEYPGDTNYLEIALAGEEVIQRGWRPGSITWLDESIAFAPEAWAQVTHVVSFQVAPGAGCIVTATTTHENGYLRRINFVTGDPLDITSSHLVWSETTHSWVPAAFLRVGETLLSPIGPLTVASVEPLTGVHQVYNIEVEGAHEYYAGWQQVRVHNGDCPTITVDPDESARLQEWYDNGFGHLGPLGRDQSPVLLYTRRDGVVEQPGVRSFATPMREIRIPGAGLVRSVDSQWSWQANAIWAVGAADAGRVVVPIPLLSDPGTRAAVTRPSADMAAGGVAESGMSLELGVFRGLGYQDGAHQAGGHTYEALVPPLF
jgi:RHS repeat-associated protein